MGVLKNEEAVLGRMKLRPGHEESRKKGCRRISSVANLRKRFGTRKLFRSRVQKYDTSRVGGIMSTPAGESQMYLYSHLFTSHLPNWLKTKSIDNIELKRQYYRLSIFSSFKNKYRYSYKHFILVQA